MYPSDEKERSDLSGNTLRVYWYVLKNQGCGAREIQRTLGFSSSSTAHYHLEKLIYKGLLIKDAYGNYSVKGKGKIGFLDPFIFIHGFVFPKQLLYAIATSLLCLVFLVFFWGHINLTVLAALLPGVLACGIFWFETLKLELTLRRTVR